MYQNHIYQRLEINRSGVERNFLILVKGGHDETDED